jgi:branched-chain amino acid transport system substrate-binding protein
LEKKGWLTGKKVTGIVFLLFLIDASCFASWYVINNPFMGALPEGAIRIGLACDTTHYSGRHMRWGAQMAVDEINAEGGVDVGGVHKDLVLVVEETEESKTDVGVERTVSAITKLINTHKVNVVLGGYATAISSLETCARYKTIYICSATTDNAVTEFVMADYDKYKYVFNVCANSTSEGRVLTEFYAWLYETYGFTKVAIIAEEYVWLEHHIGYFKSHTPEGMEIVYEVRFPSTVTTFMPYLTEAKKAGAELIMPLIALDWAITFIKEWAAMKLGLAAGLAVPGERSTFWEETGGAAKYYAHIWGGLPKPNATEKSFNFYNGFYEKYGEDVMYCADYAYTAVYAYKEAVERAGTLESDAVVAELEKTHMITPYSILEFCGCHSPKCDPDCFVYQFSQWIEPGYRPTVWTWTPNNKFLTDEPIAYADLTLPPWLPSAK